MSFYRDSA